jgi:hypothetical protein
VIRPAPVRQLVKGRPTNDADRRRSGRPIVKALAEDLTQPADVHPLGAFLAGPTPACRQQ